MHAGILVKPLTWLIAQMAKWLTLSSAQSDWCMPCAQISAQRVPYNASSGRQFRAYGPAVACCPTCPLPLVHAAATALLAWLIAQMVRWLTLSSAHTERYAPGAQISAHRAPSSAGGSAGGALPGSSGSDGSTAHSSWPLARRLRAMSASATAMDASAPRLDNGTCAYLQDSQSRASGS
jgi:hypothetical protein